MANQVEECVLLPFGWQSFIFYQSNLSVVFLGWFNVSVRNRPTFYFVSFDKEAEHNSSAVPPIRDLICLACLRVYLTRQFRQIAAQLNICSHILVAFFM